MITWLHFSSGVRRPSLLSIGKKLQWGEVGGNRVLDYCLNTQHCWDFPATSGEHSTCPGARSWGQVTGRTEHWHIEDSGESISTQALELPEGIGETARISVCSTEGKQAEQPWSMHWVHAFKMTISGPAAKKRRDGGLPQVPRPV